MFKKSLALVALLSLLLTPLAEAKKIAFFWGGGGEPQSKNSTMFDVDLLALGPALQAAGYELNLAFAVGHKKSEKDAESFVGFGQNKPFTPATIKKELENLYVRITSGEIKDGDQILLIISTHGYDPDDNIKLASHMVRVTNFKKTEGYSLDGLIDLRNLAEKYKIKFALMDLSCYAGASLALATAKTCVVASSSPQELSYTNFAKAMAPHLKPNTSLEEAFLKGRRYTSDYSSPEISSFPNAIAKIKTLLNSTASSPVKSANSGAAINRQLRFLQNIHGKKFEDLAPIIVQIPQHAELATMKEVRDKYQAIALRKDQISFEQLDEAKSVALTRYYYLERTLYEKIYQQFQNQPGPNPCRDFKF